MSVLSDIASLGALVGSVGALAMAYLRRKPEGAALNAQARHYEAQAVQAEKITDTQAKDLILRFGIATGEDLEELRVEYRRLAEDHTALRREHDLVVIKLGGVITWWRAHLPWERNLMSGARRAGVHVTDPPALPTALTEGV